MERKFKIKLLSIIVLFIVCSSLDLLPMSFNIKDFGAKPDVCELSTKAIQAAIDSCSASGGGTVVVPAGTFRSGSLFFKTGVTIYLEEKAVLKGSDNPFDYQPLDIKFKTLFSPVMLEKNLKADKKYRALIFAEDVDNIAIAGKGTIDGNGGAAVFQLGNDASSAESVQRPILILAVNCRKVRIEDVKLRNSAYWMQNYLACEDVCIRGISVYNHCNYNNDGIDIDSRNVLVENCYIDSDDDGICLKSHDKNRFCENIVIRNCVVKSNCNAIKLGTASVGGFKNIMIENVTTGSASERNVRDWQKIWRFIEKPNTGLCGLSIENVDGGCTENVKVNNLSVVDVHAPIFIKLGNRSLSDDGHLRNIEISNVTATSHSKIAASITGYQGRYVESVVLKNISMSVMGGGTFEESKIRLPEKEMEYPEINMFGDVSPTSGLFVRHVNSISLQNIKIVTREKDYRPTIMLDDVKLYMFNSLNLNVPIGRNKPIKILDSSKRK